ncbi:hypothetical protein [Paenibacillus eucommiae]|uniref:Uncharacterized protein n=1 Tax=Paenibacillus eucommiae TaxID=1355755 RepID=A0ABS4J644_9BACL|nr:hypothetical protein [Paenibacillus eucommiae]MBP1995300.1 hypothetical protein [Paenibacillus eucommiae]
MIYGIDAHIHLDMYEISRAVHIVEEASCEHSRTCSGIPALGFQPLNDRAKTPFSEAGIRCLRLSS